MWLQRLTAWLLLLLVQTAHGIYEDQAGELDWSVENVGRVVAVAYGGSDKRSHANVVRGTTRAAYIASDSRSRAIARIDAKTGSIKWRRVLHTGDEVDSIQLTNFGLFTVSGSGKNLRLWDIADGALLWDNMAYNHRDTSRYGDALIIGDDRVLVLTHHGAGFVSLKDGGFGWRAHFPTAFTELTSTIMASDSSTVFVLGKASTSSVLYSVDLSSGAIQSISMDGHDGVLGLQKSDVGEVALVSVTPTTVTLQSLENAGKSKVIEMSALSLPITKGTPKFASIESQIKHALIVRLVSGKRAYFRLSESFDAELIALISSDGIVVESLTDDETVFHITSGSPNQIQVKSYSLNSQLPRIQWDADVDVAVHGGEVVSAFAGCPTRKKDSGAPRCRALLVMKDDGLIMTTNEEPAEADTSVDSSDVKKNVLWTREEALASIQDVQWITPAETEIEKQPLKGIPTFVEELKIEVERLKQFVEHLASISSTLFDRQDIMDTRKRKELANAHFFGFSKFIVVLTHSGRLFAIRAETNEVAWSTFVGPDHRLFVTRDHPALGSGAELLLISKTGQLTWLDGDDGHQIEAADAPYSGDDVWAVMLPKRKVQVDEDASIRRAIALVSKTSLEVTLLPKQAADTDHPEAENFFFNRFDETDSAYHGYTIERKSSGDGLIARQVWSIVLPADQAVVATSRQRENVVIDSSVTITGDDSLLLKYLNPHMFGIATLSTEKLEGSEQSASVLHMSLVDAVSGRLIHRVRHMHGAEPVHMVQSENWVVYSFWNSKEKRTELVSLSLFDGAVGSHSLNLWKRPSWSDYRSSYDPRAPFVLQKSYVYPAKIATLSSTITARGITPYYVLVGMENGQIFKLGRDMIDPRQPDKPPTPEEQEEGLMQYNPLIPMHNFLHGMVTYNKTIANLKTISTTPVELESTTLVFAHGLDLFYVRFAPAKAYDVLPQDFNYEQLVLLCLVFLGANYAAKTLAQRKALNEAWK